MEKGKIVRIEGYGLGFVQSEGSRTRYPFTFDKIQGYGGQPLRALGVRVGSTVNFELRQGEVSAVQLGGRSLA